MLYALSFNALRYISTWSIPLFVQLVGCETYNLTITHDDKVAIITASALYKATLCQEYACVDALLKFSYLKFTHNSKSFDKLTGQ